MTTSNNNTKPEMADADTRTVEMATVKSTQATAGDTSSSRAPPTPEELNNIFRDARLSLPPLIRIPLASTMSFFTGMALGAAHGSKMAGLQFRAEHAHKMPTTTTGWYLYHKSKNYHVAYGGILEGLRMGRKVSILTTAVFCVEQMFDSYRRTADVFNTVIACVAVGGGFSLWNRFSLPMAARTTKAALAVGIVYGGLQDMIGTIKGRPIGYVDFIKRQVGSLRSGKEKAEE